MDFSLILFGYIKLTSKTANLSNPGKQQFKSNIAATLAIDVGQMIDYTLVKK